MKEWRFSFAFAKLKWKNEIVKGFFAEAKLVWKNEKIKELGLKILGVFEI